MDIDTLVSEICRRVQDKMEAFEEQEARCKSSQGQVNPKLLILTRAHGTRCHEALESSRLAEYYELDCALQEDYDCDIACYEAVIAYNLSNEVLGKIANGIFDNGYTRLFGEALLSGKKVFLPREEVELYQYRDKAPALYYKRLLSNLKLLMDSGVVIAPNQELQTIILTGNPGSNIPEEKEICIAKHIITEKDITAAHEERAEVIAVDIKAILTDLAKEYANKQKIAIVRKDISPIERR